MFEGCVSRIARDARHGIDRGALNIPRVERYLSDSKADLANIAAEAIGGMGSSVANEYIRTLISDWLGISTGFPF